jgi:hypothetical protein
MRLTGLFLLFISFFSLAKEECFIKMLSTTMEYTEELNELNPGIAIREIHRDGYVLFILLKTYSKESEMYNFLISNDDVVRDLSGSSNGSLMCNDSCQILAIGGMNFVLYRSGGGFIATVIDRTKATHIVEFIVEDIEGFESHFLNYKCESFVNESLFNSLISNFK